MSFHHLGPSAEKLLPNLLCVQRTTNVLMSNEVINRLVQSTADQYLSKSKAWFFSVWVLGLRIDPLCFLAGCHMRRLNQAPLNLHGLIWLLMMDWSERGNIRKRCPLWEPFCKNSAFCSWQENQSCFKERRNPQVPDGSARGNKKKRMLPHRPTEDWLLEAPTVANRALGIMLILGVAVAQKDHCYLVGHLRCPEPGEVYWAETERNTI